MSRHRRSRFNGEIAVKLIANLLAFALAALFALELMRQLGWIP